MLEAHPIQLLCLVAANKGGTEGGPRSLLGCCVDKGSFTGEGSQEKVQRPETGYPWEGADSWVGFGRLRSESPAGSLDEVETGLACNPRSQRFQDFADTGGETADLEPGESPVCVLHGLRQAARFWGPGRAGESDAAGASEWLCLLSRSWTGSWP